MNQTPMDSEKTTLGKTVLIVEDDPAMIVALKDGFALDGFKVISAAEGPEGLRLAEMAEPDIIILDVMLPKMNGLDICRHLRGKGNQVPIIMLTARGQEIDKVLGLKLGADDYVTKPFSLAELLARTESVLRRSSGLRRGDDETGELFRFGEITVNTRSHEVFKGNKDLRLSSREFLLLTFMIKHRGKIITRDQLLDAVWGYDNFPFTRTVDTHVAKLRKKIEERPSDPQHLITVHRVGYKFIG